MKKFTYIKAATIKEAASALKEYKGKSRIIAGGTDLLGQMMDEILPQYPEMIVDIKNIPDMDYIREEGGILKIGALTKLEDISKDKSVQNNYTALAEAAGKVASPHIREMGTIAGNICQSNRCWYYWSPDNKFDCIRKGGNFCNALTGENRYHSIFGAAKVTATSCSSGCPGSVNIPAYLSKIRKRKLAEAAFILLENNPLPALTGRVCPHNCEKGCNRNEFDEAVSIKSVERFMGDYILDNAFEFIKAPKINSNKSVAIVGSGPAGLSAAYYLRKSGHSITVFDKMAEPGGMLTYTIPNYRLPIDVVRKQIRALENMGIVFKNEITIGTDVTIESLRQHFDGVFLGNGAWGGTPSLGIEDEELMEPGLDFLTSANLGSKEPPSKKVLVIGGGNVAVDVALTALRLGAKEVTMACLESREEMPAFPEEIEQALAEGVKLMVSRGPVRIQKTNGKASGMEMVKCVSVFDSEGRFSPIFDNSAKETVAADQILLAIGQRTDISFIDPSVKTERGLIMVDNDTGETSMPGLFAGGDITSGPASVIDAIAAGRRASKAIDRYFNCTGQQTDLDEEKHQSFEKFDTDSFKKTSRAKVLELPIAERKINIEDVSSLGLTEVKMEAKRCFNCGCVAVNASDIAPALIALNADIKTSKRTVKARNFFGVEGEKTALINDDEVVTEIQIPKPSDMSKSHFLKFTLRKSIDFPIVNCASAIEVENGVIKAARICLNAVYNTPYKVEKAEEFLIGQPINEAVAEAAGVIAIEGACPLSDNKYKVQIAKTLVKRTILAGVLRVNNELL